MFILNAIVVHMIIMVVFVKLVIYNNIATPGPESTNQLVATTKATAKALQYQ